LEYAVQAPKQELSERAALIWPNIGLDGDLRKRETRAVARAGSRIAASTSLMDSVIMDPRNG